MSNSRSNSRRHFLSTVPSLALGSMLLPKSVVAETQTATQLADFPETGLTSGQPLPLTHAEIPGFLSAAQLQVHHDKHYVGALNGYHKLDGDLLNENFDDTGYSARSRTRTHKANSTMLHELYFSGLAPKTTAPDAQFTDAIQQRFGSLNRWWEDFQAAANSSRGWALLVYQPLSKKLYNIISDNHGDGVLWTGTPILALDMFEHAYYLDYQNNKTKYIRRFINHIEGQQVSMRYQRALLGG